MYQNQHSKYAVKKRCDQLLSDIGLCRRGFVLEDCLSHFEYRGIHDGAEVVRKAIERISEL